MKARFITILAAAALLASCAKDALNEAPAVNSGEKFRLTIGLPQTSKIVMGESVNNTRPLYWSDGDQINVNGNESAALENLAENTTSTEFTFDQTLTTPYNVLYPAAIYTSASQITLPASQTYKSDGFADGMFPMAGYSADGSSITMSPLCAVVKVQVKRAASNPDEDNLVSVTFKGRNSEQVRGLFTIDYEHATLTGASDAAEDKAVKVVKSIATSTAEAAVYYVVVPAGTYSNGFDVIVKDRNGHFMTQSKTASVDLVPGKLYGMAEFEFVPTGTEIGIEITSAEDLIQFATNYNNKVYEALGDEPLIATLTSDIIFDTETSAQFNATGGIGMKNNLFGAEGDYYFNGAVYGDNHSISGLIATVPIFAALGEGGAVSDLIIDENCSFTFTHPNTTELDAGALVGYNKGVVTNVSVDADVTLVAGEVSQVTALGGIAGRVTIGTIDNCTYSGNLSVPEGFEVDAKRTYIGGLVGSITNANGKVQNSDFEGTIDFAGIVASTDKTNPYLMLGGIVGAVNAGTVSGCEAKGTNTKEITMDNSTAYTATIQNHSRKVYHLAQGGIAGYNAGTVSSCTNGASVKNFVLTTGTQGGSAADGNSRYYDFGGIVGLNASTATVTGCTNNGLFESRSTPRIQKIGGVVGYNKGGTVSSSSNASTGSIYITTTNISPYSLRVGEVGGVIGNNEGTVSNVQNAGNISMDRTENAAGVELKFGGVIGLTSAAIDGGAGKSISNSGNISDTYNGTTVTTAGLRFGGIVGSAQASIQNVTNSGKVTFQTNSTNVVSSLYMGGIVGEFRSAASAVLSNCENEGEVFFNAANNAAHTGNYVGGILGFTYESNVAISGCTNSGYIHGGNASKQNGKTMFVGGIAAYLDGASSVDNCENNGVLLNNQFNNTNTNVGSTFEGGIIGFALGTADNRISITNVTNDVNDGGTITGGRRGFTGGAVGYGEYVDITNATNTNSYSGGSGYWYGGIAGWLVNGTISNSTYSGTSIASSQIQGGGGIVCTLDEGSELNNCYSYLTTITHAGNVCVDGSIAAKSVAGSTIKNCHYSDVYAICSDTNFTDGGGNVADL